MDYICNFKGSLLPFHYESEIKWPNEIRLVMYLAALGYTFLGVAIISDVFMNSIEKITSSKKRVKNKETGRTITVYVWNATVANLTLMALGSSAPEILLSLIEITVSGFQLGPLGAGTIVGSAAFNLLCISAVCVLAIPDGEVRYIKEVPVYVVTSTCSVFAYLWLMFIVMASSPDVCEIWEAVVTLLYCPILVVLAYLADRGYFNNLAGSGSERLKEQPNTSDRTLADDVSDAELAAIEQEIRDEHGVNLTTEQVIKIMQATYFQKKSRAYYRHAAMDAALHGKPRIAASPELGISEAITTDEIADEKLKEELKNQVVVTFAAEKYCVLENAGHVVLKVMRSGVTDCKATVKYATRDGTANANEDYVPASGVLTFEANELEQEVRIEIKDDVAYEDDEEFYICLAEATVVPGTDATDAPSCQAHIGIDTATVVIIDDDQPGQIRFRTEEMEVVEGAREKVIDVTVERFNGATGTISCHYHTESMGAVDGIDYVGCKGTLEFQPNIQTALIQVTINARGRVDQTSFNVVITDPKNTKFDDRTDGGEEKCICCVTIKGQVGETRRNLFKEMKARAISANAIMGQRNWLQQFQDAVCQVGDDDDEDDEDKEGDEGEAGGKDGPSYFDYFIHFISIPWKVLFAFVPPPDYCGGWACFCGALVMIAVVTAIVSDVANLVGCCFNILPETCAITFVALGTSLPDTFASKTAAMMDPFADASIGNVTGSNSINVFLGIGIAWCAAAFRWQLGGRSADWDTALSHLNDSQRNNVLSVTGDNPDEAVFITPAGTIWFNLMVFAFNAMFAIQHLYARRRRWGGELGGPKGGFFGQHFSAFFLLMQWFLYIGASVLFARLGDSALTYEQIAAQEN